jgi:tetratricopeptide (TPR) repeat protein
VHHSAPRLRNALGFSLSLASGKGRLGLSARTFRDLITIEQLELEIPGLRFPFDVTGGPARFQHRRCALATARFAIDEARLSTWLRGRPGLKELGLTIDELRLESELLVLAGTVRTGDCAAELLAKAELVPAGGPRVALSLCELRLFGYVPIAAPELGARLLALVASGSPKAVELDGATDLVTNPAQLVLQKLLPEHGWRAPDTRAVAVEHARVRPGRIEITYGASAHASPAASARFGWVHEGKARYRELEALIAAGEAAEAYAGYRRELAPSGHHPFVIARTLELSCAQLFLHEEAQREAEAALLRRPDFAPALAALAQIADACGDAKTRAERLAELAQAYANAGETEDAARVRRLAGDAFLTCDPEHATQLYEQALAIRPRDPRLLDALAVRYAAEARHDDLERLLEQRLNFESAPAIAVPIRLALARLVLARGGAPKRARAELERAIEHSDDPEVWDTLAEALAAEGNPARALAAADRAARIYEDRQDRGASVRALTRAADAAAASGDLDGARERLTRASAHAPGDAEVLIHLGRLEEVSERLVAAQAAYRLAVAHSGGAERALALTALGRVLERAGEPDLARARLAEALTLAEPIEAVIRLAKLHERNADWDQAAALWARAQAAEPARASEHALARGHALRQAGRLAEAERALEEAAAEPAGAKAALRALGELLAARGDEGARRRALERLLALERDPEALLALAELDRKAGALTSARERLEAAVAGGAAARSSLAALAEVCEQLGDRAARADVLGRLADACEQSGDADSAAAARHARGQALLLLGRATEAIPELEAALARMPEDAAAWATLARAHAASENLPAACAAWERVLALPPHAQAPEPAESNRELALLHERAGNPRAAARHWRAALAAGATGVAARHAWSRVIAIALELGEPVQAIGALERSATDPATEEGPRERAGRLLEAGQLARKQGDDTRATGFYQLALELDPAQMGALDALEGMAGAGADWQGLRDVLRRKVAAVGQREGEQRLLLLRLAEAEQQAGDVAAARAAYERVLTTDPNLVPALSWLARQDLLHGDLPAARARYEQLARADATPGELRGEAARALGNLARRAGDDREAERQLRRALELDPGDEQAFLALDRLYASTDLDAPRADLLARWLGRERKPERLLALGMELGAICERLGRGRAALTAYRQVLSLHPLHVPALMRLAEIARQAGAHEELLAALERLAEIAETSAPQGAIGLPDAANVHLEIAELCEHKLTDLDRAERHLRAAVALAPGLRSALATLERLARARADLAAVDDLLGRRAAAEPDPAARAGLVVARARMRLERGEVKAARSLLEGLADPVPDEALTLRADLEESRGDPGIAVAALDRLAERARANRDAHAEATIERRRGKLLETRLGREADAARAYERACAIDPADASSAESLVRLAARRGGAEARLAAQERLRAALARSHAPAEREAAALEELSRTLGELGRAADALQRLREATELEGTPMRWRKLAQAAQAAGDLALGAAAMRALAERAEDPPARAEAYATLADLLARSADHEGAQSALAQAAQATPPGPARDAMERRLAAFCLAHGRPQAAASALERLGAGATASDRASLAEAYEQTGRLAEAAALWHALEQTELAASARHHLARLYRAGERPADLARLLERCAAEEADAAGRADALAEAAGLYLGLGDRDAAARCARAALSASAQDPVLLLRLARALPTAELRGRIEERAHAAPPATRVALYEALAGQAGETADAAWALAQAAELEPDPARAGALRVRVAELTARLYEHAGDLARAEQALAAVAELHPDPRALLLRVADLCERRGDAAARRGHLERLLARFPDDETGLVALYADARARGDQARACAIGERLFACLRDPARRGELAAELAAQSQGRAQLSWLRQAAELSPDPRPALSRLADCAAAHNDGDEEARALALLHDHAHADERGPISLRLARLCRARGEMPRARLCAWRAAEELATPARQAEALAIAADLADAAGELDEAYEAYSALAATGQAAVQSLTRLAELAGARGEPERQVGALVQAAEQAGADDPARAAALLAQAALLRRDALRDWSGAADLLDRALARQQSGELLCARAQLCAEAGATERAVALYEQALCQDPPAAAALLPLADYHDARGRIAPALDAYTRALAAGTVSAEARPHVRTRVADLCLRSGDVAGARLALEEALREDPGYLPAQTALSRLEQVEGAPTLVAPAPLADVDDWQALAEHLAHDPTMAAQVPAALAREAASRALRAGATDAATQLLAQVAEADPQDTGALVELERLQREHGDLDAASETIGRQIVATADPTRRAELWHRRAMLYAQQDRDHEMHRCLKEALANDPESPEPLALLCASAEHRGEWALAAELYYRQIALCVDARARAQLLLGLARLYAGKLDDPEQAARNYEEALATDPELVAAQAELSRLRDPAAPVHDADESLPVAAALEVEHERLVAEAHEPAEPAVALTRLRRLLELEIKLGRGADADVRAQELLARAPDDPLAFAVRKRALSARNDEAQLVALLHTRAQVIPDPDERATLLCQAATLCERLGDGAGAIACLDAAIAAAPGYAAALEARADLATRARDFAYAADLYTRAVACAPELADSLALRRGELADALGDGETAEAQLRIAVHATAGPGARQALARVLTRRGRLAEALEELNQVESQLPAAAADQLAEVREQMGDLAARLGRPEEARNALELVLAYNPTRATAIDLLAGVCAQLGQWERAAELQGRLARLAENDRARAERLFRQGEIYRLQMGDLERAGDCYLRASDLDPKHAPTLWRLVEYFFAARDWEQLLGVVRDLATLETPKNDPLAPHAHEIMTGLAYALRGDREAARPRLELQKPADLASHAAFAVRRGGAVEADAVLACVSEQSALEDELARLTDRDPGNAGAHLMLSRLRALRGDPRAHAHAAVLAFLAGPEARGATPPSLLPAGACARIARDPTLIAPLPASGHTPAPQTLVRPSPLAAAPSELAALVARTCQALAMPPPPCAVVHEPGLAPRVDISGTLLVPEAALPLPAAELAYLAALALELARSGGPAPADVPDDAEPQIAATRRRAARAALTRTRDLEAALCALARLLPPNDSAASPSLLLQAEPLADLIRFALAPAWSGRSETTT